MDGGRRREPDSAPADDTEDVDDTRVEPPAAAVAPSDALTIVSAERAAELAAEGDPPEPLDPKISVSALAIGDVIGEGGMGVVRSATQLSLARRVAVKTTREGASEADAQRMLREAWVTGFLEHPGVVPIYDIARGDHGPVVVMRRIAGETWHECLHDEAWASASGARDLLEQNLRVFVRVCEILEFGHDKGVIHRDIKPGNVMIGAFGEVYLLDWGLALALRGEAARHLPTTAATREIAGTMAYAAPEMVDLVDAPLTERTDIYLLGALLFEIATGARPHAKPTATETIASIDSSPPEVPDHVSPRLAAPLRRAMQRLPADRHDTVAQLRHDVLAYLRTRDSELLSASAVRSLEQLRAACVADAPSRRIHELHAECRFAFREALRTWPRNEEAARGLVAAATLVIERELTRDPRSAAALLDVSDGIEPGLAARVRAAADELREEDARLAQMSRDHDDSIGRRTRRIVLIVLGASWATTLPLAEHIGPVTHVRFALGGLFQLVVLGVVGLLAPDVTKTLYSRRILTTLGLVFVAQIAIFLASSAFGASIAVARTVQIGMWAFAAAILTVTVERRFWPMTVGAAVAFTVAVIDPSLRSAASVLAALGVTLNMALTGSSTSPPRT
jgi:serine/threonine-protein kinase